MQAQYAVRRVTHFKLKRLYLYSAILRTWFSGLGDPRNMYS